MKAISLLIKVLLSFALLLVMVSCEQELLQDDLRPVGEDHQIDLRSSDCDAVINFNGLTRGAIVNSISSGNGVAGVNVPGSISVYGENAAPGRPAVNHAMIFDTDNPTGGDNDLVVPGRNHQEVLIVSADLDSNDPDDQEAPGGKLTFNFNAFGVGYVDIRTFTAIDNEGGGMWWAYNGATLIGSGNISSIPNGTDQTVTVNKEHVTKLVVQFNESGAIDNICMKVQLPPPCEALIDFNGLTRGAIVNSVSSGSGISGLPVSGAVSIYGKNLAPGRPAVNHAMIFDTDNVSGDDPDLVVPGRNHQELLIISEDLDASDPDDQQAPGGEFTLDFTGLGAGYVDVKSFTAIDNEGGGKWEAYNGAVLVASGNINTIPNGTDQTVTVNANHVTKLVVRFNESGGLDNICIDVTERLLPVCEGTLVDFNGLMRGTIVNSLSMGSGVSGIAVPGTIGVYGKNLAPGKPAVNHAMIYDTDNPSGEDPDLIVPGRNHQEILIISEDLHSNDPDDQQAPGGEFTFNFTSFGPGYVDVTSFTAIDNEGGGKWWAYNGATLVASGNISSIPNRTDQNVVVNASHVTRLVIRLNESGAIDELCLNVEEATDEGCTRTQGFWQNEKKGAWPAPYSRTATFYLSGWNWQRVLQSPVQGNAYYQLAHQFIAATLNVASGASAPVEVTAALATAHTLFNTYTPAAIAGLSGNNALRKQFISLAELLDKYNNGLIGPGHCDENDTSSTGTVKPRRG